MLGEVWPSGGMFWLLGEKKIALLPSCRLFHRHNVAAAVRGRRREAPPSTGMESRRWRLAPARQRPRVR